MARPRYWERRRSARVRRQRLSQVALDGRDGLANARDEVRAGWRLLKGSARYVVLAATFLIILELLSLVFRQQIESDGALIFKAPDGDVRDTAVALVSGTVAFVATLLGLYYTTVGVIASTIYKSVPSDLRDLFIQERRGSAYLKIVLLTITSGLLIQIGWIAGYEVASVSLLGLGVLAMYSCIGLVIVSKTLFDFFDPSNLSTSLLRSVAGGIRTASEATGAADGERQKAARAAVGKALQSYANLLQALEADGMKNSAPLNMTRQMLAILRYYSSVKSAIPVDSLWWREEAVHQNWLTIDPTRLRLSLATSVGVSPESKSDFLWIEHKVLASLRRSLEAAFDSHNGSAGLSVLVEIGELIEAIASRLQMDEVVELERVWVEVIANYATTESVADRGASLAEINLNQAAAAEALIYPLTKMLLGVSRAADYLRDGGLKARLSAAIDLPDGAEVKSLPMVTRQQLAKFGLAIGSESRIFGRRVTPDWWVCHLLARSLLEELNSAEEKMLLHLQERTFGRFEYFVNLGRRDLAAIVGIAALELFHKIGIHGSLFESARQELDSLRSPNIGIDYWPKPSETGADTDNLHRKMVVLLAGTLSELRTERFDPKYPDLYGQIYQFTFDAAFRAILSGARQDARTLYAALLLEAPHARRRLIEDLAKQEQRLAAYYIVEPLVGLMELSGYSLLMSEIDGVGVWGDVKNLWSTWFSVNPDLVMQLANIVDFVDSPSGITAGGLERSRRSIEFDQILEDRGISKRAEFAYIRDDDVDSEDKHSSPIVRAFLAERSGFQEELHALFVAEFLKDFLPTGTDMNHAARRVAERIAECRAEGEEGGVPIVD